MTQSRLKWESLPASTEGAPDLWRTPVVGGWLVGHGHALAFVPDRDNAWAPKEQEATPTAKKTRPRSDKVVVSPVPGVATTEAELEAFRVIEEICAMDERAPDPARLAYTDTESFFVVHLGSPLSWAFRIAFVASGESWISFNLPLEEAKRVAPNVRFLAGGFGGDVRAACDHPDDLRELSTLIVAALAAA